MRLIDSCITQLKAQGPSRTCNESKEEVGMREGGACNPRVHRKRKDTPDLLDLYQSIWAHQFGETALVFAQKLTDVYHNPGTST